MTVPAEVIKERVRECGCPWFVERCVHVGERFVALFVPIAPGESGCPEGCFDSDWGVATCDGYGACPVIDCGRRYVHPVTDGAVYELSHDEALAAFHDAEAALLRGGAE